MIKRLLTFAATALVACTTLSAQSCCDPCWDPCDWGGDFAVGADALYWKPMHCTYNFGFRETTANNITVDNVTSIKADYDWGLRLYAGYMKNCTFVDVSFLWLETRDALRAGDGIETIAELGILDRVTARINFDYHNVDIRLGQMLHKTCGCLFYVFGDLRWVYIKEAREVNGIITGSTNQASVRHTAKFDGAGLGVGLGGQFCIWNGFNGFGRLSALGIIGDRRTPVEQATIAGVEEEASFHSHTCVVPALDLRLGLNYQWDCGCISTLWELGYEVDYYFQVLNTVDEQSGQSISSIRSCKDIGFAGPYVGLKVLF